MTVLSEDTIMAVATPSGKGALAIIRVSGPDALSIANSIWKGADLNSCESHTVHLGNIVDEKGEVLDQAVATIFKGPKSFTGEDVVEFSLHGSPWIIREVSNLLLRKGARGAEPGEFSRRAYLNGRMDLASAEGVADLIASSSRAAHKLAIQQTRGAFSKEFNELRDKLIELASLLELELDFSEEDVEFADRTRLIEIATLLLLKIDRLTASYATGRAIKEGVPVVIAGMPNVGKSTLLNALLQEDKAIVSDIPGTTRDIIEDTCEIDGILFRFIDTAGLRESSDTIESIGIERARRRLEQATIVLWLIDPFSTIGEQIREMNDTLRTLSPEQKIIPVITKTSATGVTDTQLDSVQKYLNTVLISDSFCFDSQNIVKISAAEGMGLDTLSEALKKATTSDFDPGKELLLTNARHYGDLLTASQALRRALDQMQAGASADFIAMDIREATSALSSLTGTITTPDLLNSIFSKFCIGK
ncbi:MAG: tRNA uridine-5-carboxymethylaminomethyl(34) synthesis GTPase MnmE [Muribaculaceae bacterium]|nr:tRNA uridine-5-carboxymethylaminomethyl(34) synthesis GTPase MnmE [Muribaculaceae bacterium]